MDKEKGFKLTANLDTKKAKYRMKINVDEGVKQHTSRIIIGGCYLNDHKRHCRRHRENPSKGLGQKRQ